jgi:putative ABC transport system permease protein
MDWKAQIRTALGSTIDEDVLEELAQHAAATYASARAEGLDAAQAGQRVAQQIQAWAANPALLRRRPKRETAIEPPAKSASPVGAIAQDTRYAWRLMRRQPAYAALVIATMALGIAATTVIGSVAYGVLLKPLPWAGAPRLVRLYENRQGSTRRFRPLMTNAAFIEWRKAHDTLDDLGAWSIENGTVAGTPERIRIAAITPGLLPILGASPALGRAFAPGEEEPGHAPVILLSHGLWQQRYGGRPDAIGQAIRFDGDGAPHTIIGVMPPGFAFPDTTTRAWVPFHVRPVVTPGVEGFSISMFQAIGRLRDGVTPAQAAAEGTARGRNVPPHTPVAMAVFGSSGTIEVSAVPLLDALTGDVKPAILILLAAVTLLLVTATANVASLQLTRATARRRELAIRSALGAARGRLVRQTLVENLLLGLLGGLAGLALAALMHRALPALLPADFPRIHDLAFDARIQAFAIAISLAAGLGCGLLPAVAAAARDVVPALVEDSLGPVGGGLRSRTARVRAAIMAGQIGIACVLLVGALLLARSFVGLLNANVGYDAANVLTARIILPERYTPERKQQIADEIVARLEAIPEVSRAAYSTVMPFAGGASLSSFPLRKRDGSTQTIQTGSRQVSAGYFAALGQKVLEGREFTTQDGTGDGVAIVNREFSRRYLEGRAMGWTLPGNSSRSVPGRPSADRPIVAVVEDTARQSVTDTPEPEIYFPAKLLPWRYDTISLVVRTTGDPRAAVPSLRAVVQTAAPDAPIESLMTMDDRVVATLSRPRLYAVLLGVFAAFALAIAGVGLFGVLSYSVALRAREIGVRAALGAQVADIVGLIARQSGAIAGAGIAAGLAASFWLTSALQKFLYGVTPHDAASFGAVAALLLVVSVLASIVPARRAARVDPVSVLRG